MTKQATKTALIKKINQVNKKIEVKIALGEDTKKLEKEHYKLYIAIENIK